jgi:hypothetical protein
MKLNKYIAKIVYFPSSGSLLTDDCSGAFFKEITRAALLTIVLGITVVLATSCASTGNAFSARLIREASLLNASYNLLEANLLVTLSGHGMPHLAQLRGQPPLRSQRPLFGVSSFSRFLLVVK